MRFGAITRLRGWARSLQKETYALYLAARHPDVPWYAKAWVACVVAYALSPIDLIPDFVPILGYLDDLILVPLGIALALKMVPPAVMEACRAEAAQRTKAQGPQGRAAAIVIVIIWVLTVVIVGTVVYQAVQG